MTSAVVVITMSGAGSRLLSWAVLGVLVSGGLQRLSSIATDDSDGRGRSDRLAQWGLISLWAREQFSTQLMTKTEAAVTILSLSWVGTSVYI